MLTVWRKVDQFTWLKIDITICIPLKVIIPYVHTIILPLHNHGVSWLLGSFSGNVTANLIDYSESTVADLGGVLWMLKHPPSKIY